MDTLGLGNLAQQFGFIKYQVAGHTHGLRFYQYLTLRITERENNFVEQFVLTGSTGKASEYELFNEVVFSLSDAEGKVLIEPQTLRMTRDLVFDETELLGKISEAEGIHRQMRRNMARQIIIRIGAGLRQQ